MEGSLPGDPGNCPTLSQWVPSYLRPWDSGRSGLRLQAASPSFLLLRPFLFPVISSLRLQGSGSALPTSDGFQPASLCAPAQASMGFPSPHGKATRPCRAFLQPRSSYQKGSSGASGSPYLRPWNLPWGGCMHLGEREYRLR